MEMKNIAKEKKEIKILCFDVENYGLPDEAGTSATIFFTLQIGERELDVRGDVYWEFSPSRFYDNENCYWFESWGFTISAGATVFEGEEILCDRMVELDGMNLHYLDISVFKENDEGERVEAEWEARDQDAAWTVGLMVDEAIYDLMRKNVKTYIQEAVEAYREMLSDEDCDDPEMEFAKSVVVNVINRIVDQALREVGDEEIQLLYTEERGYELI
ncbi:MAG: hypothetical protein QXZ70_07155 [Candidatus Bathyarchaeia archaeon]